MRLWKMIDGVPYMVNDPRLGILSLNPKRGKRGMAKRRYGARHMAWVRSFQKRRRKHNYVMAGPVVGLNPKRRRKGRKHYRRNPGGFRRGVSRVARGFLGLPPVMPIVYGVGGFAAVAGLQGVVSGFVPAEWLTDAATGKENMLTKYGILVVCLIGTTWLAKSFLGGGAAALAGIGGGIYVATQAAHDFMPGVIPGMHQYAPIGGYTQIRAYRQIRQYAPIGQIAAPDFGSQNTAASAGNGGANIVQARFRRFQ